MRGLVKMHVCLTAVKLDGIQNTIIVIVITIPKMNRFSAEICRWAYIN